jgi:hypothetical protein
MTSPKKRNTRKQLQSDTRRVVVRGVRHDPPNLHKLAKLIVSLAETLGDENHEYGSSTPQTPTSLVEEKPPITRSEAA